MKTIEALALVGGHVEEEMLIRNEYLAAENEILKSKLEKPLKFNNYERIRLAKIGKRMGIKALKDVACIVKPETIMKWVKKLVAKKFDGSGNRKRVGRPQIDNEIEKLIIRFAMENQGKGNVLLFPSIGNNPKRTDGTVERRTRLDGMLNYYYRKAA